MKLHTSALRALLLLGTALLLPAGAAAQSLGAAQLVAPNASNVNICIGYYPTTPCLNLPVQEPSNGTIGSAIVAIATLVGGSDGTNLRAVKVSTTGIVSADQSSQAGTAITTVPVAYGSGTPSGNAPGVNAAQFIGTTAQTNDGTAGVAAVGGHLANDGAAAATNRLPTLPAVAQTSYSAGTALTQGRNEALQVGTDGLLWTASLPAMRPASFLASASYAGSSTTDNARMPGNATNTVLLTKIVVTCTQTTAGTVTLTVNKRSTAGSGGTAANMTVVPMDSNYAAGVSVPQSYTGTGPTVGTLVGQLDAAKIGCNATATAGPNDVYVLDLSKKPIVLRGTAENVVVNFGGAITGGNLTTTFQWIETNTITP